MSAWLSDHWQALKLAWRRLSVAPLNSLLSALAIGIVLALPASGEMLLANAQALLVKLPAAARISVFMTTAADQRSVGETAEQLRRHEAIKSVHVVGRAETLARMRAREDLAEVITLLPANPFPDAFVVEPKDERPQSLEALAAELRRLPQVEHVQLDSTWARRLDAAMRLSRTFILALTMLLGVGLVAITFNTIRLQVLGGSNEIEVSRLLGATDSYVGRPFRYFGLIQGLAGGSVALLLTLGIAWWLRAPIADLAAAYGLVLELQPLSPLKTGALLSIAAGLGWLGAALSVRQHLRAG
jgi:cell division transport system permease protein